MHSRMQSLHSAAEHFWRFGDIRHISAILKGKSRQDDVGKECNILNRNASVPYFLGGTSRTQEADTGGLQTLSKVEEVGLVIDREQGLLERNK